MKYQAYANEMIVDCDNKWVIFAFLILIFWSIFHITKNGDSFDAIKSFARTLLIQNWDIFTQNEQTSVPRVVYDVYIK